MKIVILNKMLLEKHVQRLKKLAEVISYTNTNSESMCILRITDADIIIVDPYVTSITKQVLLKAKKLKYIATSVVNVSPISSYYKTRGILISNIPGYATESVAELTIALILALYRKIPLADKIVRINPIEINAGNPNHDVFLGRELKGKTIGIIGAGQIGTRLARLALAFGMKILIFNRGKKTLKNCLQVSLKKLLKESDIVSLHITYDKKLEKMIGKKELSMMKSSSVLIKTSSGNLVDERALYDSLKRKKIAGAGIDVLENKSKKNPLLKLDNVVFTPHLGFYTEETLGTIADMVTNNVESYIKGQGKNIVQLSTN